MNSIHYPSITTINSSSTESAYKCTSSDVSIWEGGKIEMTLAIIKPEAVKFARTIEKIIKNEGFVVIQKRKLQLTPEQASEFYGQHYGKTTFPRMVLSLSNGPIIVLCLSKENAIKDWKTLLGPTCVSEARRQFPNCLRAHFGSLAQNLNGLHGSDSPEQAETEIHFFFSKIMTYPIRTEQERIDYLKETLNPTLAKGLIELCRKKPADPLIWLANWLLENNPYQPKMHAELQQIPT